LRGRALPATSGRMGPPPTPPRLAVPVGGPRRRRASHRCPPPRGRPGPGVQPWRAPAAPPGPAGGGTRRGRPSPPPPARSRRRSAAVVAKLELDAEILAAQMAHDRLQLVAGRAAHAHFIALDTGLGLLEAPVLHGLHDLLRDVAGDALRERH